ncbi:glycosyltransferase family 2 protein [Candidatus Dependentiae bacterium]|nr:glycosyltransferase family 2 protein [Candidatus Dependentiae bacterium]
MYRKLISASRLKFLWCIMPFLGLSGVVVGEETVIPEFVILTASYNNERYCEAHLASVANQRSSKPYKVIIVNDCSTDSTAERLDAFVRNHNLGSFVTLIHNTRRCGSLENIYSTIHNYIEDHKIVVCVDGDDQLASDSVLLRLEQEYKKPYIHLTHGTFRWSGTGIVDHIFSKPLAEDVIRSGTLRSSSFFIPTHLKTFRAGLFKQIRRESLMFNGSFFEVTGDIGFMFPMFDMLATTHPSEPNHIAFIPDVLYNYNSENPISDGTIKAEQQQAMYHYILNQPPYAPLDKSLLRTS